MKLTTQMIAEIGTIELRYWHITQKVHPLLQEKKTFETKEFIDASIQEMNTYKVRLENLLCETDIKEQAHL